MINCANNTEIAWICVVCNFSSLIKWKQNLRQNSNLKHVKHEDPHLTKEGQESENRKWISQSINSKWNFKWSLMNDENKSS